MSRHIHFDDVPPPYEEAPTGYRHRQVYTTIQNRRTFVTVATTPAR